MVESIATASSFMTGLGVLLAFILSVANRKLYVYEDPRIDEVESMLPHTNCGACGTAGCRVFAQTLIAGETVPNRCTVNSAEMNLAIADYLGVDAGDVEKQVARLACAGGNHVATQRARYDGMSSCRAAAQVSGGGKACSWGCLGLGDCQTVCDQGAIHLDRHGLPIVDAALCTACGDCVEVCPKALFSLQPVSHHLWVACKNLDGGDEAEAQCDVVCNACGRCAVDAPEDLITMSANLAHIDYRKNALLSKLPIQRCPTGAIVWLDDGQQVIKGEKARKIVREMPLPLQSTAETKIKRAG